MNAVAPLSPGPLRRMRVLYLNPFGQAVSGADESLLELLRLLIPHGVEAHIVLPPGAQQAARYLQLGAEVHFAPLSAITRRPRALPLYGLRLARGIAHIARLISRIHPDLIHSNMETCLDGALAAKLRGIPHVLHYRGNTCDDPKPVFDALTRVWSGLSDSVVCISEATADIFRRRGIERNVLAVYDPVSVDTFAAAKRDPNVRISLGAGSGDVLVGCVARLNPRKAIDVFIRAAALSARRCPQARFVLVGNAHGKEEARYQRDLRELARSLGIEGRVTFAGARSDMPSVMRALDLLVLCSRHEGFGRVVPEAMAAGVPVILAKEGALVELVDDGSEGFLVPAGDPQKIAEYIDLLVRDPSLRRTMGQQGSNSSCRFKPALSAERILAAYASVARREPRSS